MKEPTAPTATSIKLISASVILLAVGFYLAAAFQRFLLLPAVVLTMVIGVCYFWWTPVEYELDRNELIVRFRLGQKRFGPVSRCSVVTAPLSCWIRLFGNGGLFAGSGIFWNGQLGVFRAYVTVYRPGTMVLVETARRKILISPRDPYAFAEAEPS